MTSSPLEGKREYLQTALPQRYDDVRQKEQPTTEQQPIIERQPQEQLAHSRIDDTMGSLLSLLTPEPEGQDNKRSTLKPKRKKKRWYDRQV